MAGERRPQGRKARGKKKRSPKQAAAELAIEERRADVARLRLSGWSIREIAAHLGCSVGTIHGDLAEVFERTAEKADNYVRRERATSLARIDAVTKGIWPKAQTGHLGAVDRFVKLEERRAKLEGLDAAHKHELSGPGGTPIPVEAKNSLDAKLDALARRLNDADAPAQPGGTAGAQPGSSG